MSLVNESNMVGFKLMDSAEATDIVDVILDDNPEADATLASGGFWELDGPDQLLVDLDRIGSVLDRPFAEKDFLVHVSSFYGRVSVEHQRIRLVADILTVADYEYRPDIATLEG